MLIHVKCLIIQLFYDKRIIPFYSCIYLLNINFSRIIYIMLSSILFINLKFRSFQNWIWKTKTKSLCKYLLPNIIIVVIFINNYNNYYIFKIYFIFNVYFLNIFVYFINMNTFNKLAKYILSLCYNVHKKFFFCYLYNEI